MPRRFHLMFYGAFLAVVLPALIAVPAWAHSFDVDIVFAQSTPTAARDGFLREFRRASGERDGHANEASDGHLGGLDVYSNMPVRGGGAMDFSGAFVVLAGEDVGCDTVAPGQTAIVITAASFAGMADAAAYQADYESRYGESPDELALSGYLVARAIDAAVRPLGGVGDVAALRQVLPGLCD